jgi:hypothetical protein
MARMKPRITSPPKIRSGISARSVVPAVTRVRDSVSFTDKFITSRSGHGLVLEEVLPQPIEDHDGVVD